MKEFIPTWRFGMELLLRLVIMLLCAAAGPALLLVTQLTLVSLGIQVPATVLVLTQVICVVIIVPLLLAGYADYCGYRSHASQPGSAN